jgi:lysophospholipase L1-like esterase
MNAVRRALSVAVFAPTLALAAPAPERIDAPKLEPFKVILVGDSTMAPHSGWGGAFCARHLKWRVACINLARGARSTRSYRAEGAWDVALGEMKVPGYQATYVLIQLGHNDQARHKPERWTEETSEYPDNLRRFVKEARRAGAIPVLVTPLARREFRRGELQNTLASWSEQVRRVARALDAPLIDLNARSAQLIRKIGPVAALEFAQLPPGDAEKTAAARGTTLPPQQSPAESSDGAGEDSVPGGARGRVKLKFDYTHLGPKGAEAFAALVAQDLATAAPELASQILP